MDQVQNVNTEVTSEPKADVKVKAAKRSGPSVAADAAKQAKKKIAKQKAAKEDKKPQKARKRKVKPNYVATKSAWYAVNPFLILTVILMAVWCAVPFIKPDISQDIWLIGLAVIGVLFALAFLYFLGKVIVLKSYKIKYYDGTVVCQFGILNKHERKSAFLGATSVVVDQTLGGRILNYGDVYIDTIGKWDIDTTYIAKPKKLQAYLEQHLITNSVVQPLIGE